MECRHGRRPVPAVDLRRPAAAAGRPVPFWPLIPRHGQAVSFAAYAERLLSRERRKPVEPMVLRQLDSDMNQVRRLQCSSAHNCCSEQPTGTLPVTREGVLRVDMTDMPK